MLSPTIFTQEKALRALGQLRFIVRSQAERIRDKQALYLRDGENGWNAIETLCHMADFEAIFLERMRRIVNEDRPTFAVYDADERVATQHYDARTLFEALLWFTERRMETEQFLRSLTPEQWQRTGIHPENGEMSVGDIAYNMICHDINHIDQIFKAIG